MIGRFSELGAYRELLDIRDVARVCLGGLLVLGGFLWDKTVGHESLPGTILILASVAVNGVPIVWGALNGLVKRQVNVDELVSLAIGACLFTGEFLSAAVVSFVMVLGSLIEEAAGESARKAIRALVKLSPDEAAVVTENGVEKRPISQVQTGDILMVKPGERIPVDAVIVEGIAAIDESSITGEPIPVEKTVNDEVFSGTLNQTGAVKIRANRVGEDTTLGRIIRLVTEAEAHHPESVALIDRYAKWFTPSIIVCAGIAWGLTGELSRAVAVLIVGCPCALILAAPTAIVASISRAADNGILIKGGKYIESAAAADIVLFDKTGTLTEGEPRVIDIVSTAGHEKDYVLRQAASVEQNSTHPFARAILKAAQDAGVEITAAQNLVTKIGLGVKGCVEGSTVTVGSAYAGGGTAEIPPPLRAHYEETKQAGATPLIVFREQQPIGVISVSDSVRSTARETLDRLKQIGIKDIGVLSGDHAESVERVKAKVGATAAWAGLKPEDKLKVLKEIRESALAKKILYVGDGINDAPALAAADVGVAMGARGTEVALETAHIALMNDDISRIPFLIQLGKRMLFIIKLNIVFGLAFNIAAVLAGGSGWLTPIMGAVVHNIGSVIVVISSASIALSKKTEF